jgi:hypothetical protein
MAAKKSRKRKSASTPWERPAPRHARHTKLSSRDKSEAKHRAKKAGRKYPNLVDNMAVAAKKTRGSSRTAKAKDPRAGLSDEMPSMRSWALRFYGRRPLPLLVDRNGQPTRVARTARAWGELVPRTIAAARRIAAKGRRLLDRYRLQQA